MIPVSNVTVWTNHALLSDNNRFVSIDHRVAIYVRSLLDRDFLPFGSTGT